MMVVFFAARERKGTNNEKQKVEGGQKLRQRVRGREGERERETGAVIGEIASERGKRRARERRRAGERNKTRAGACFPPPLFLL